MDERLQPFPVASSERGYLEASSTDQLLDLAIKVASVGYPFPQRSLIWAARDSAVYAAWYI